MTRLDKVRAEVRKISKQYGTPGIEPGIFDLVIALRYAGFKTSGSCEGHYNPSKWRYPWVLIVPSEELRSDVRKIDKKKLARWMRERKKLTTLISQFNSFRWGRTPETFRPYPEDEHLVLDLGETIPSFLVGIKPAGAVHLKALPQELLSRKKAKHMLRRYRRVMQKFATFIIKQHDRK